MPLKDPEARKAYQKAYAAKNRTRAYQKIKEWRAANPERWAAQRTRYRKKHPDIVNAKTIRWRTRNPEKYAEMSRATRKKNYARVLANKAKYRAVKKNRTPGWLLPADFFEIQCIYRYRIALKQCGLDYEVDHILPLQGKTVSGLHVPENLQVISARENRLKNNRVQHA
jgi:hypothetical protein